MKSVTDLEIEEAIREAWTMVQAGAPPSARRLAAVLLAVTGGTQAHPYWVTPDDLWRDRLAVLADQGAWLASWGPRPGEPNYRVPPALLPESQTRRENAYALWRSTVPTSPAVTSESNAARKPQSRFWRRDDTEQAGPARPRTRRGKSRVPEPNDQQDLMATPLSLPNRLRALIVLVVFQAAQLALWPVISSTRILQSISSAVGCDRRSF